MALMSPRNLPPSARQPEPVRRIEAGPWMIELLPAWAYATRYISNQSAMGFAFDSQRGLHAIGSDRVLPFTAMPNSLAFVPAGCDVLSESPGGGEYLRVVRTDGMALNGDRAFNNRLDQPATLLASRMRSALLRASVDDDWEAWALALAQRALCHQTPPLAGGSITPSRMRLLDEFIEAGLDGPIGVKAMAQMLGLSEGYFIRVFKTATGQSPHAYLVDRRVSKARALMRDTPAGLSHIALACGFSSQAHMATVFRHRLGVSPGQLRRLSQDL